VFIYGTVCFKDSFYEFGIASLNEQMFTILNMLYLLFVSFSNAVICLQEKKHSSM